MTIDKVREEIAKAMYYDRALSTGKENWEVEVGIVKDQYLKRADKILSIKVGDKTIKELVEEELK